MKLWDVLEVTSLPIFHYTVNFIGRGRSGFSWQTKQQNSFFLLLSTFLDVVETDQNRKDPVGRMDNLSQLPRKNSNEL